ncbi:GIY-YIG nuclease family protein [Sulfuricurvum sp.]|uniref:GIY-YIG nuclease family protein n=1 Tax=Sulfuricurvum sp. TaxID=2025608 RepID=UPI003459DED9
MMIEPYRCPNPSYTVYILRCSDGTLYTGISLDPLKRVQEHNASAKGAKYTRSRRPVSLVYQESCGTKSDALKQEAAIKKLSKIQKEALVTGTKGGISKGRGGLS